jgi:hypothetical protein
MKMKIFLIIDGHAVEEKGNYIQARRFNAERRNLKLQSYSTQREVITLMYMQLDE